MFRQHKIKGEMMTNGLLPIASRQANTPRMNSKGWFEYSGVRVDLAGSAGDLLGVRNIDAKY